MFEKLDEKGIRLTVEAEEFLKSNQSEELIDKIISLEKLFISKEDIDPLLKKGGKKVEVIRPADFQPIAKDYNANIQLNKSYDVTGNSRTRGSVENFVSYFRNRFERLSKMLHRSGSTPYARLGEIKKHVNEKVRIIVIITKRRETKKGNLFFQVEDMTGSFNIIVSSSKYNEKVLEKAKSLFLDDVVAITGKVLEPYMIVEDIEWPDLPVVREKKLSEADLATVYLSDIHFGSKYFLSKHLKSFTDWLHGKGEAKELAGKVKYICIAGDVVDGIGIYPNQEKELVVTDIYKQYEMLDDFIESLPDHIEVIIGPGNHDAVRRGEPQPALSKEFILSDVVLVGNPTCLKIEGLKHIMYHGTSIDSMIANSSNLSYTHPERVMVSYLKRRHLSPIYGGNLIVPENSDYMVIDDVPDILHCGHVHKNGYTQYRGTIVINSGTFQARTDFQVKQGHVPTPALVPIYEMKYGRLRTLDFNT